MRSYRCYGWFGPAGFVAGWPVEAFKRTMKQPFDAESHYYISILSPNHRDPERGLNLKVGKEE